PLEIAPVRKELLADRRGFVERLDAATIGHAVADVGGGRRRKEDAIDYGVGVLMSRAVGDQVERGDLLMTVVARTDSDAE
ncbi:thymidine phosphorylase, partial [Klebsiella pneumoniae]